MGEGYLVVLLWASTQMGEAAADKQQQTSPCNTQSKERRLGQEMRRHAFTVYSSDCF